LGTVSSATCWPTLTTLPSFLSLERMPLPGCSFTVYATARTLNIRVSWYKIKLQTSTSAWWSVVDRYPVDGVNKNSFVYLGSFQYSDDYCRSDTNRLIGLTSSVTSSLPGIWKNRHLFVLTSRPIEVYRALVMSVCCTLLRHAHDSSFTWRHTGASSKTFNNNNNELSLPSMWIVNSGGIPHTMLLHADYTSAQKIVSCILKIKILPSRYM